MNLYRIKDWDANFENHKSRSTNRCGFCCVPNKQDGLGYSMIMQEEDGPAIYGAFVAVLLMASKQPSPRQGYLTDTGGADGYPLGIREVSLKTKVPEAVVERMLEVISSPRVGWITRDTAGIPEGYRGDTVEATKEGKKERSAKGAVFENAKSGSLKDHINRIVEAFEGKAPVNPQSVEDLVYMNRSNPRLAQNVDELVMDAANAVSVSNNTAMIRKYLAKQDSPGQIRATKRDKTIEEIEAEAY